MARPRIYDVNTKFGNWTVREVSEDKSNNCNMLWVASDDMPNVWIKASLLQFQSGMLRPGVPLRHLTTRIMVVTHPELPTVTLRDVIWPLELLKLPDAYFFKPGAELHLGQTKDALYLQHWPKEIQDNRMMGSVVKLNNIITSVASKSDYRDMARNDMMVKLITTKKRRIRMLNKVIDDRLRDLEAEREQLRTVLQLHFGENFNEAMVPAQRMPTDQVGPEVSEDYTPSALDGMKAVDFEVIDGPVIRQHPVDIPTAPPAPTVAATVPDRPKSRSEIFDLDAEEEYDRREEAYKQERARQIQAQKEKRTEEAAVNLAAFKQSIKDGTYVEPK